MIRLDYDVLCVGAGGAGVTAAVFAATQGARVALLSKDPIGYGNTRIALGAKAHTGLAEDDSVERFSEDLLAGGEHLNHPALARLIAEEAPQATGLAEGFGHIFRRDADGRVSPAIARKAGGHRSIRTVHSSGYGGVSLGQSVRSAAARAGVEILEEVAAHRLFVRDGRVHGLLAVRLSDGELLAISARAVVLATGGAGWLYYPHTDNLRSCTGDGYALALDAGAALVDMEQVQFIPFATSHPASQTGIFLGEPVSAGPHGRLLDGSGHVVLTGIAPMTRAEVAVVISRVVAEGNGTKYGGLLLDLAPNYAGPDGQDRWKLDSQSPIYEVIRRVYGQKAYRCEEPWDVCPSAHFNMGGVAIDEWGRSSVPGLFAAGEAAGGVHGGNRLGSAALVEIFVFGRRAGLAAATWAKQQGKSAENDAWYAEEAGRLGRQWESGTGPRPVQLVRRLQQTMWRRVGLVRSEVDCEEGLREIERIGHDARQMMIGEGTRYNLERLDALELEAMLLTAESMLRAALIRRESRGAHFRSDYPDRNAEAGKSNIFCVLRDGRMETYLSPVGSWTAGGWPDN